MSDQLSSGIAQLLARLRPQEGAAPAGQRSPILEAMLGGGGQPDLKPPAPHMADAGSAMPEAPMPPMPPPGMAPPPPAAPPMLPFPGYTPEQRQLAQDYGHIVGESDPLKQTAMFDDFAGSQGDERNDIFKFLAEGPVGGPQRRLQDYFAREWIEKPTWQPLSPEQPQMVAPLDDPRLGARR